MRFLLTLFVLACATSAQAHDLSWKGLGVRVRVPGKAAAWKMTPGKASADAERKDYRAVGKDSGWQVDLVEFENVPRDPMIAMQQGLSAFHPASEGRVDWSEEVPGAEAPTIQQFSVGAATVDGHPGRFAAKSWIFDNTNVVLIVTVPADKWISASKEIAAALGSKGAPAGTW
jgi:hypothetical protein